jgi:uncharacterized membrane protein YdbT with pleckstrin-like domain
MRCSVCNVDVPAGAAFCPGCGQRVGAAAVPPPATAAITPADSLRAKQAAVAASADTEQELWHGSYSPKAMYGSWVLAGIATIVGIAVWIMIPQPPVRLVAAVVVAVLWLVLLAWLIVQRLGVEYVLTNQRLIHKSGVFRRRSNRVEVIDIDDVTYEQGFVERMFGVGTIKLLSSDVSDPVLVLRGIDNVQRVATLIDNARRDERRKRGLYVESV